MVTYQQAALVFYAARFHQPAYGRVAVRDSLLGLTQAADFAKRPGMARPGHASVAPGLDGRPQLFFHAFILHRGYNAFRALSPWGWHSSIMISLPSRLPKVFLLGFLAYWPPRPAPSQPCRGSVFVPCEANFPDPDVQWWTGRGLTDTRASTPMAASKDLVTGPGVDPRTRQKAHGCRRCSVVEGGRLAPEVTVGNNYLLF